MSDEVRNVDTERVTMLKAARYSTHSDSVWFVYYVGFIAENETACRLSDYYKNKWQAEYAMTHNEYVNHYLVTKLPSGNELYYTELMSV